MTRTDQATCQHDWFYPHGRARLSLLSPLFAQSVAGVALLPLELLDEQEDMDMTAYAYPRPILARVVLSKRGWKNWGDAFLYHRGQGHDPSSAAEKADAWEKQQIRKIRKGKHLHEKQS